MSYDRLNSFLTSSFMKSLSESLNRRDLVAMGLIPGSRFLNRR